MKLELFVSFALYLATLDRCHAYVSTSPVKLRSEWPTSRDPTKWVASLWCPIYLDDDYTPDADKKGFYVHLILQNHATNIQSVFYPFDGNSIFTEEKNGLKHFVIKTATGIWENKGQKYYEIHVAFRNTGVDAYGRWPRGSCSGPYDTLYYDPFFHV